MNSYLVDKLFELGTDILDDKCNHLDQIFDLILDEFGYSLEEREHNDVARDMMFDVMNREFKREEAIEKLTTLLKKTRKKSKVK